MSWIAPRGMPGTGGTWRRVGMWRGELGRLKLWVRAWVFPPGEPMKPTGLDSDALSRVDSEPALPYTARCRSARTGFGCGRCSGGFCKVSAPGEERTFFFFLNLVNYPQGGLSRPDLEMCVRSWRWFTLSRCKFMVGSVPPTFGPSFDLFHSLECAGILIFHREIRLHRFYGNIC